MKRWILLIFCINQTLEARCQNIQQKIEKLALNGSLPCGTLYDRIMRLYDLKNSLINLSVLHKAMAQALTEEEAVLLEKTAVKNGYFKAGEGAGSLRGLGRILKRCETVLAGYGFDEEKFERRYPYLTGSKKRTSVK